MKRQLSILFLTQEDFLAGSTYSVFFLAQGLAERGHSIYVAARHESLLHRLCEGTQITFLPLHLKSRFDLQAISQIKQWVREFKVDVINAQSSKDRYASVFSRWIYSLNVRVVHTRRQLSLSIGGPIQNLVYVNGTDKIVAVGSGVKQSLISGGIPERHIELIYNGTPEHKYRTIDKNYVHQLREKFKISPDDLVIGCIARRKHQDELLRSLDNLGRPAKVIFVGIQSDEELELIINKFKFSHQVFFEGDVPSERALNYLKLFNVYALCSTTEGLSQSIMEAMYLGVPVVATNASGNNDLISDGENGLLYEHGNINQLAEHILTLSTSGQRREWMIDRARKTVMEVFNIDNTVKKHETLFHNLTTESRKVSLSRKFQPG
ncbi:MAG: glycosyltransferase family 4 protein [Cyclobacteriaceae bacterium]